MRTLSLDAVNHVFNYYIQRGDILVSRKGKNVLTFEGYLVVVLSFSMICLSGYSIWSYTRLEYLSLKALIGMLLTNILIISALFYIILTQAYFLTPRNFTVVLRWLQLDVFAITIIYSWTVAKVKTQDQRNARWFLTVVYTLLAIIFVWLDFAEGSFHL